MEPMTKIAIVGLACEYPGAHSPDQLWTTALTKRRWFRNFPAERLDPSYFDPSRARRDTTAIRRGAFIEGYSFPLDKFLLGQNDFRSADFSHWLALHCADRALNDAGHARCPLPARRTRVIVGNTLAGETSRANLLRLRWPYVRKTFEESGDQATEAEWLQREEYFKARLAPVDGKTLAGALPNVIAGRIGNHFNFMGGAFSVDAACASSLVAVAEGCNALVSGEIDCCVVGGVDVSLDPLELVGFSVAGAFAQGEMLIFDESRTGFLPGEGCGFAVLMRLEDALASSRKVYATIRGWGISSDGHHDLVRPKPEGQGLALAVCYEKAGYDIGTVAFFEAHGTGTVAGDEAEVLSLQSALSGAAHHSRVPAALGSIKANIGHTKAAAGLAGLIKATLAVKSRIMPPTTGCPSPMGVLKSPQSLLRILDQPEEWPEDIPSRAGVSAFGFGGVNAHITIEEPEQSRSRTTVRFNHLPVRSQDTELFLFDGISLADLHNRVTRVQQYAAMLAEAQLPAVAAATASAVSGKPYRAAVIAATADELASRMQTLLAWIDNQPPPEDLEKFLFFNRADNAARLGFLFPGQSGPDPLGGELWKRFSSPKVESTALISSAEWIQASLVSASTQAAELLAEFGILPNATLGHSLGEISALHASGVLLRDDAIGLARDRGRLIDGAPEVRGSMAAFRASSEIVGDFLNGDRAVISAINSAKETIISGTSEAVGLVRTRASEKNCVSTPLDVAVAFHSPLMEAVVAAFSERLKQCHFQRAKVPLFSSVTGKLVPQAADFASVLARQLTAPVLFQQALLDASKGIDIWLELGAAKVLTNLATESLRDDLSLRLASIEYSSSSLHPFLRVLALAFVRGHDVNLMPLYLDRAILPHDLDWNPVFLSNPCEEALPPSICALKGTPSQGKVPHGHLSSSPILDAEPSNGELCKGTLDTVRALVAAQKGLGFTFRQILPNHRLGSDLGIDSLGLIGLTLKIEGSLNRSAAFRPDTGLTVEALSKLFENASPLERELPTATLSDTLEPWVRTFEVKWVSESLPFPTFGPEQVELDADQWRIVGHLPPLLVGQLPGIPNGALLIVVAAEPGETFLAEFLAALDAAPDESPVIFLDPRGIFSGFAKTLHLERPGLRILILRTEIETIDPFILRAELVNLLQFREVRYDDQNLRLVPRWEVLIDSPQEMAHTLSSSDVVLVSGGAKGITAQCAFALAEQTGATLALVGRSLRDSQEVATTLFRFKQKGIKHFYYSCDLVDKGAVAALVNQVEHDLGPITALIHGAGTQKPCLIAHLTPKVILVETASKIHGFRHLIDALDLSKLKIAIAFGSVIANSGYVGSAAYALANAWLAWEMESRRRQHGDCKWLVLDWSAWAGVGMGESLNAIPSLKQNGVDPLPVGVGIKQFLYHVGRRECSSRLIITGRLPNYSTVSFTEARQTCNPLFSRILSHVPAVELVVELDLSLKSHQFLADHVLDGTPILPGVYALEFMAQAAQLLTDFEKVLSIEDITFSQRIEVGDSGITTLRIQAIRQPNGFVHCRLIVAPQQLAECVSAIFGFEPLANPVEVPSIRRSNLNEGDFDAIALDLYKHLLFHGQAFQRVTSYSFLNAHQAIFHLKGSTTESTSVLTDEVNIRDAFIHGIQACVPGNLLLPVGIATVRRFLPVTRATTVIAAETLSTDAEYIFELTALDHESRPVEVWTGIRLSPYRTSTNTTLLHPSLQAINVERLHGQIPLSPEISSGETFDRRRYYEYRHLVGFKESNALGNVYFTNHLEWQGRCRELFLRDHAPSVLRAMTHDLTLVTLSCSCKYLQEIHPFDELSIRMTLMASGKDSVDMRFEYYRVSPGKPVLAATGTQTIACFNRTPNGLIRAPLPIDLVHSFKNYS
jgi:enediyne polyketide synthase